MVPPVGGVRGKICYYFLMDLAVDFAGVDVEMMGLRGSVFWIFRVAM